MLVIIPVASFTIRIKNFNFNFYSIVMNGKFLISPISVDDMKLVIWDLEKVMGPTGAAETDTVTPFAISLLELENLKMCYCNKVIADDRTVLLFGEYRVSGDKWQSCVAVMDFLHHDSPSMVLASSWKKIFEGSDVAAAKNLTED